MGRSSSPADLTTNLRQRRTARGWSQDDLARRSGITRQAVNAIEAGRYVPNTAVAMRLAKALACLVEDLFRLSTSNEVVPVVGGDGIRDGDRVVVARVGERLVSHPLEGANSLSEGFKAADGIARSGSRTTLMVPKEVVDGTAFVVGCDPSLAILASRVTSASPDCRLVWIHGASQAALRAVQDGHAHIAGTHLPDTKSANHNLTQAREALSSGGQLLAYTSWEQGFMVVAGNPHAIRGVEDLTNRRLRIVNREVGSGSRALLDHLVRTAKLKPSQISGYDTSAKSHADVARTIAAGAADAGIGLRAVAAVFGLDFVPIAPVRFDLVVPAAYSAHPAVKVLQDVLQTANLRTELGALPGYDVSDLGAVRAQFNAA